MDPGVLSPVFKDSEGPSDLQVVTVHSAATLRDPEGDFAILR